MRCLLKVVHGYFPRCGGETSRIPRDFLGVISLVPLLTRRATSPSLTVFLMVVAMLPGLREKLVSLSKKLCNSLRLAQVQSAHQWETFILRRLPSGMMPVNSFHARLTLINPSWSDQSELSLCGRFVLLPQCFKVAPDPSQKGETLPSHPFIGLLFYYCCYKITLSVLSTFKRQEAIGQWFPGTSAFPAPHDSCTVSTGLLISITLLQDTAPLARLIITSWHWPRLIVFRPLYEGKNCVTQPLFKWPVFNDIRSSGFIIVCS